jgi:hypothetical protein
VSIDVSDKGAVVSAAVSREKSLIFLFTRLLHNSQLAVGRGQTLLLLLQYSIPLILIRDFLLVTSEPRALFLHHSTEKSILFVDYRLYQKTPAPCLKGPFRVYHIFTMPFPLAQEFHFVTGDDAILPLAA